MVKDLIKEEIKKVIKKNWGKNSPAKRGKLDVSSSDKFGDYASNVAMIIKEGNPLEVAEKIKDELCKSEELNNYISKIEVAKPGFINFYLSQNILITNLKTILEESNNYGKNKLLKDKKIIVEYTDPNPFKEFHIGHLMTNVIGESVSKILEFSSADIKRVNYQGDVGMHVAKAIWGLKHLKDVSTKNLDVSTLGKAYALGTKESEKNDEVKKEIKEINKKIYERSSEELNDLYDKGRKVSLEYFEEIYKKLGTKFDHYFFESEVWKQGVKIVENHINDGIFESSEGAIVFKGEEYGLHTRVFINSEGLPTYEAKDLGLVEEKFNKYNPDFSITVTGDDVKEYFNVIFKVMELINPDWSKKSMHLSHGVLRLPDGKMSSRTGDVITAEELIGKVSKAILPKMSEAKKDEVETVALGAIKYSILKQSIGKNIIFDFEKSISFEGASGPYLQYTYARANSILEKAKKEGIAPSMENSDSTVTISDNLKNKLYMFTEVVERSSQEYAPHYICTYLFELAQLFNSYYAKNRMVDKNDPNSPYKIALTKATAQVLKNGLWLLGIKTLDRM